MQRLRKECAEALQKRVRCAHDRPLCGYHTTFFPIRKPILQPPPRTCILVENDNLR